MEKGKPIVGVVMGSESDRETMKPVAEIFEEFGISYEWKVISAHRTPEYLHEYVSGAEENGVHIFIAGAGGAAHLPGVMASFTTLPIIGVPVHTSTLNGMDSLLSIVQMPKGIPVATMAIGKSGARNAALFAVSILSLKFPEIRKKLNEHREKNKNDLIEQSKKSEVIFPG